MSEREQSIADKVSAAIPEMTEFDQGYLLGKVEEMAAAKRRQQAAEAVRRDASEEDARCPSSLADGESA